MNKRLSMGLEETPCSSCCQGQLQQEHLFLLCFFLISSISDVTMLYWIWLNILEEEKMPLEVILVCWFEFRYLMFSLLRNVGWQKKKIQVLIFPFCMVQWLKQQKQKQKQKKNLYLARAAKMMNCILYHSEILSLDFYTC